MAALTLADLKPRVVEVEITDGGRVLLSVPLAALSWSEYHRINMTVEDEPKPMVKTTDATGAIVHKPKTNGPEFEEWREAQAEAVAERKRRRLAVSLIRAGNFPEMAGATLEEQAKLIDELDVAYVRVLYDAMDMLVWGAKHKVADMAERFRPDDVAGSSDMSAERVDAGEVVQANGSGA